MWEGTRMIGETRDKGDPAGALRMVLKLQHLPRFLFRDCLSHFLQLQVLPKAVETYYLDAHIPSPSRQLPKPAKHVVSPPTSILAYDNCHDTRTLHRTIKFATM